MKLLLIDPNLSLTSPSMKGIVGSLPALKARGWEIESWCWDCDAGLPVDRVVKLPRLGKLPALAGFAFSLWGRLRAWWKFQVKHEPRPDVIYSVAWYLPQCDVAHVHFSHWDWSKAQHVLGMKRLRDVWERGTNAANQWWAERFLRGTSAKCVLTVSPGVADDVRKVNPQLDVRVLPNSYDPQRCNPEVRSTHRKTMRERLGFGERDVVFAFASAGHYRRKGFFLAVDAVAMLQQEGARLLVIGGTPARLKELQGQLDARHPAWREFVIFTGMVPDVERYFAASDAFLFPSYSEAFGLVSLEAAACGLPLFLTRHQGAEMMLDDGVNGRYLDFDAVQIAHVLAEFIHGDWKPKAGAHLKHALDSDAYAQRLADELAAACGGNPNDEIRMTKGVPAPGSSFVIRHS